MHMLFSWHFAALSNQTFKLLKYAEACTITPKCTCCTRTPIKYAEYYRITPNTRTVQQRLNVLAWLSVQTAVDKYSVPATYFQIISGTSV